MGVLFGQTERRDAFPYPVIPPNDQAGGTSLRSVSLARADSAMQKVAIFAAVRLIADVGEELSNYGSVLRGVGRDKQTVATPKWLTDPGGKGQGLGDWVWQLLYCWCLRGNVVGRFVTDADRFTVDLQHPDDVSLSVDPQDASRTSWRINGKTVPTGQIWHRRVFPVPGRVLGLSPIAMHAVTIQQGLYAQNFGAQWFLDGAHPSSILTNDKADDIDQAQARTVKQRFIAAVRGTREPVVLGGGWKYQQIQIAPGESQFLETQNLTSAECARIYGPGMPEILGYATGGSMTYANIEQRSVDLLKYTLDPWLTRVERVISEFLPKPQYFRFDRKVLLQTDTLTRFQSYQYGLKNGFLVANEVRDEEDMQPVAWGDQPYLPALGPAAAAAAVNDDTLGPDQPGQPAPSKPAPIAVPQGGTPA